MKVNKNQLLSVMKQCLPGVEKGSSLIEGADTFVFTQNSIHSYNDNISVSAPFPFQEPVDGSVKSEDFFKLISKLPGDEIDIESEPESFKINAGKIKAEMVKIQSGIGQYIQELKLKEIKWKDLPDNLREGLSLCKIDCNRSPQRGIFISENEIFSTDFTRINYFKMTSEMEQIWIDDPAINDLMKIEKLKKYSVNETWVHFQNETGTIFSTKRKDDKIYPIQKVKDLLETYKEKPEDIQNVLPEGISEVADRINILSKEIDGRRAIKMTITPDGIEFFAERYSGKIQEKILFAQPFKDENIKKIVWIDPSFLIDISKKAMNFYLRQEPNPSHKTLIFFNDNYTQITSTYRKNEEGE